MKSPAVAIVGMACRYPDADSPEALWENVLAQRRAFRRIPATRLNLEDYGHPDPTAPDRTYVTQAALLEGYTFDRVRYRVSGSTYRSADLAHWLALDVAAQALEDAGFPDGAGLPHQATGVIVGNTLTGEFSRAQGMRLRWPYVRRVMDAALAEEGWSIEQRRAFLERVEPNYKAPFPPVGTETLAGGLSNTIAGRICNYFDLQGGGYTVDGACSSSLLALINACSVVAIGDLEIALAGGVDLSLDPFELVGFAKVGALAPEQMRVYDTRSNGFWPGEGCGFVVLMRYEEALRQDRQIYAVIRGWGVSSDGCGGITRPEVKGQLFAVQRAYQRAAFGIDTVGLFEGHGTGTTVGDTVELRMLTQARQAADAASMPAAIGSVKANIGHTKAAAGIAGIIKATMALHEQMLPPTTGCESPHAKLNAKNRALRVLQQGESWPSKTPLRAGVSAMGFGGINTHVVLENKADRHPRPISSTNSRLLTSAQDAELFFLGASDQGKLQAQINHLLTVTPRLALSDLSDLAALLARSLQGHLIRAAIVASSPSELTNRLEQLNSWLEAGLTARLETGCYLDSGTEPPRIGLLFPGQGSPIYLDGGVFERRFKSVQALYANTDLPQTREGLTTEVAQPAIVTASMAGLRVLERVGLSAYLALGHSLGELTALHWAGAFDENALLNLAKVRGQAMASLGDPTGSMAGIAAAPHTVEQLLDGEHIVIAGFNGPHQTVVSGKKEAIGRVVAKAKRQGVAARRLPVSHAFHSSLVADAAESIANHLSHNIPHSLQRPVLSTITGTRLSPQDDLSALLVQQVTSPVRFTEAIKTASPEVDLWIEVGPGRVLSGLIGSFDATPVVSTDAAGASLKSLLGSIGAAYAMGAAIQQNALFEDRFTRPFSLDWNPQFFVNPCELAPESQVKTPLHLKENPAPLHQNGNGNGSLAVSTNDSAQEDQASSTLDLLRSLVAARAELPLDAVRDEDRLLGDLHLNSITVSEILLEATQHLHLPPSAAPTTFADETLAELAKTLESEPSEQPMPVRRPLEGIRPWVRPFTVALVEHTRSPQTGTLPTGSWQVFSPPEYPLLEALSQAFDTLETGQGVVVALPANLDGQQHIDLLLKGSKTVLRTEAASHFVLIQHGKSSASFARTLHQEAHDLITCIINVPLEHPDAVGWILDEVRSARGYVEAHYDSAGVRSEPRLRLLPLDQSAETYPIGPDDVILITGGGKGITAACALALGRDTGAQLLLWGRSHPSKSAELAATLNRMKEADVRFHYTAVDLTHAEAVGDAIKEAEARFGPITGIIHGAARNAPQSIRALDEAAFAKTLAPKVDGLRNILTHIDPERLNLLVTFGSIIARIGLPGEADYALANEWLAQLTEQWQQDHPHCHCRAVEWSVWDDVGMGARLGSLDSLTARGVTPIPPDTGTALLKQLLAQHDAATSVVATGLFGNPPTLNFEHEDLPFLRFLEQPRRYIPGVELIVDVEISTQTDLYLEDHILDGERLFPAVMGLEAMAQAAMALAATSNSPTFEKVTFNRPIVVPKSGVLTLRLAALAQAPDRIEVAVRSETTGFEVDHFRAMCCFEAPQDGTSLFPELTHQTPAIDLDPERDLYGEILFHQGRFKRIQSYRHLHRLSCVAEITSGKALPWFGRYLPSDLILGDPGARDAAIHAIQACIPQATIIPTAVDQIILHKKAKTGPQFVYARERIHEGDTFIYDMQRLDAQGNVLETWEGLRLHRVGQHNAHLSWPETLLSVNP